MKSLSREIGWMVLPVLVLGGIGYLLRNRKPAVLASPGPFQPYIKGWKPLPLRPADVADGYDTRLEVELGADCRWTAEYFFKRRSLLAMPGIVCS